MRDFQVMGLDMLREAGIQVILDHHALPGVQVAGQMFTGKCVILFVTIIRMGNLMPYIKLYLNSPILCGYFSDIFCLCFSAKN
jgi:glucan endo-1,6-beta-glucosidase